jgi:hypothetical protein
MTTLALKNKKLYEQIIERYLAGQITGDEAVSACFAQRSEDNPVDTDSFPTYPADVAQAWDEFFTRLFNANEDVVFGDPQEASGPFPISEAEYRDEMSEILPLLRSFDTGPRLSLR